MIIMFVRHAEAVDDKLTDLGIEQCKLLVKQNDNYNFSKIYSSSANRCLTTALYLSEKYGIEIIKEPTIKDREMLLSSPKTKEEKEWFDNYLNPDYSNKNPEGCKEFLNRNFKVFDKIISENLTKNNNVIIVGHSCTCYALLAYFNKEKNGNINWYRIGNCSRLYFEVEEKQNAENLL